MKTYRPDWVDLPRMLNDLGPRALVVAAYLAMPGASSAQIVPIAGPGASEQEVVAIEPPRIPLPPEAESVDVTRFSFIVYGDTRGRRDG